MSSQNATSPPPSPSSDEAQTTFREENISDFSPQWCQEILNDKSYVDISAQTRRLGNHDTTYNSLLDKTLFTSTTIRAIKYLYKPPKPAPERLNVPAPASRGGEVLALISLGTELCSHANVLHGGINTTIVDQVGGHLAMKENTEPLMAVNMNVNLRKAVRTPGVVLCRAWIERRPEGRKVWIKCRTEQEGLVCIESENLYVKVGSRL